MIRPYQFAHNKQICNRKKKKRTKQHMHLDCKVEGLSLALRKCARKATNLTQRSSVFRLRKTYVA